MTKRRVCYTCFMLHYWKRPYAKYLHDLNWQIPKDLTNCEDCKNEPARMLVDVENLNMLVCESVIFADSDIYWLIDQIKEHAEFIKNETCGHAWNKKMILEMLMRSQIFIDRMVELVWKIDSRKWRYGSGKKVEPDFVSGVLKFPQLNKHDVARFFLIHEYCVVHEVIHEEAGIYDEDMTHRALGYKCIAIQRKEF